MHLVKGKFASPPLIGIIITRKESKGRSHVLYLFTWIGCLALWSIISVPAIIMLSKILIKMKEVYSGLHLTHLVGSCLQRCDQAKTIYLYGKKTLYQPYFWLVDS